MELNNKNDLGCELKSHLFDNPTDLDSNVDFKIEDYAFVIKLKEGLDYVIKDNKIVVLRPLTDSQLKALSVSKDKKISNRFITNGLKSYLLNNPTDLDRINKDLNSFDSLLKICLEHKDILYSNSYESEDEFKNDLEKILDNSPNRDLFLARVIDVCENHIIFNKSKLDTVSVAFAVVSFLMSCEF